LVEDDGWELNRKRVGKTEVFPAVEILKPQGFRAQAAAVGQPSSEIPAISTNKKSVPVCGSDFLFKRLLKIIKKRAQTV